MTVYIVLEHQLEYGDYNFSTVASTRIIDVFSDKEIAEIVLKEYERADEAYVKRHLADPCKYELVEWEVK